jgi:hypothetical protein
MSWIENLGATYERDKESKVSAWLLLTPTDFRSVIGFDSSSIHQLFSLRPEMEPTVRRALDRIFNDLTDVDNNDLSGLSCYLDSITEELYALREFTVTIFAIGTFGKLKSRRGPGIPWSHVYFFIVLRDGYFGIERLPVVVHKYDPNCDQAVSTLLRAVEDKVGLTRWWIGPDAVIRDYEGKVPWCSTCCIEEISSGF